MNITNIREKMNMSQKEFSEYFELDLKTLQEWEQGISKPQDYVLKLIVNSWKIKLLENIPMELRPILFKGKIESKKEYEIWNENSTESIIEDGIYDIRLELGTICGFKSGKYYCEIYGSDLKDDLEESKQLYNQKIRFYSYDEKFQKKFLPYLIGDEMNFNEFYDAFCYYCDSIIEEIDDEE